LRSLDGHGELRRFAESDSLWLELRRDAGLRTPGRRHERNESEAGKEMALK
jgi:hypothetical protein